MQTIENNVGFTVNPMNKSKVLVRPIFAKTNKAIKFGFYRNKNERIDRVSRILIGTDKMISERKIQQIVEVLQE